jgi:hypothetical protein
VSELMTTYSPASWAFCGLFLMLAGSALFAFVAWARSVWILRRPSDDEPAPADDGKNPAAVALGRLGGLKGGKARAESLSKAKRAAIAKKAAAARWKKD